MSKYNFMNNVYAQTDEIGEFYGKQCVKVGWESYGGENSGNYSLDEVNNILNEDLNNCDNCDINECGEYFMKAYYCSFISPISIVNGIIMKGENEGNLVDYCKRIGIASDSPKCVSMYAGEKSLSIKNGKYVFKYTIDEEKLNRNLSKETIKSCRKLSIGSLKRLTSRKNTVISSEGKKKEKVCEIDSFDFNEADLTLTWITNEKNASNRSLIDTIKTLDLEFHYLYNKNMQWNHHLSALRQLARDCGQPHLINESFEDNDKNSNIKWYDK